MYEVILAQRYEEFYIVRVLISFVYQFSIPFVKPFFPMDNSLFSLLCNFASIIKTCKTELTMRKIFFLLFLTLCVVSSVSAGNTVERWRIFEVALKGPQSGNPFTDHYLTATFRHGTTVMTVRGFYDGDGIYRLRFMPELTGRWTYTTKSDLSSLNHRKGAFVCTAAREGNHGPVVVKDSMHFAYADGSRYVPFGTTCYAWVHQQPAMMEQTIQTLKKGYFNKMRFCIFPKYYDWNHDEPLLFPYEGKPDTLWDYSRFNPAYFRNIEHQIQRLDSLGIEADLIVFHPYDKWGFSKMSRQADDRYISYLIARLAAYKNVWWSMANEYDLMKAKRLDDWNHYLEKFAEEDPYHHLRSIHQCFTLFDHHNKNITHVSIQNDETFKGGQLLKTYHKPVVYDECRYEGNIAWPWGSLTAQEMTDKVWRGTMVGAYVGHGETYDTEEPARHPSKSKAKMWWSRGGVLRGQSPARILFCRHIIESAPGDLTPAHVSTYWLGGQLAYGDDYFLIYYNQDQPKCDALRLPAGKRYRAEIIDAWNMTVKELPGTFSGDCVVPLPAKPMTALRLTKIQ